jgi:hypothetical protein
LHLPTLEAAINVAHFFMHESYCTVMLLYQEAAS